MIETIVIIILALAFICATCFYLFNSMKSAEEIARLDTALQKSNKELEDAKEHTYDVLKEWAESMDKHDKAYTELANKNMKLEAELELRDIEVERLKGIITSISLPKNVMEDSTDGDETISV